jgi:tetratricopeptide (TPR) repeat protein
VTQVGRNDRCPCGSGKKYKKCCLLAHDAQVRERLRLAQEREQRQLQERRDLEQRRALRAQAERERPETTEAKYVWVFDELDLLSNSVLDLIKQERFEEALLACERLLRDYPDVGDGFERSALVHDALGNHALAADFWSKAVDFVEHPDRRDGYDEELIEDFRQRMNAARERAAQSAATLPAHPADQERAP